MTQSESLTTSAQRETQQAIKLLREIAWSHYALWRSRAVIVRLKATRDASLVVGNAPPDFATLARESHRNAARAAVDIPLLEGQLESERITFEQRCVDLGRIAPSVRVRMRTHRRMFSDTEVSAVMQAFERVSLGRLSPWVVEWNEGWEWVAIRALEQLPELLRASKVTTKRKRKKPAVKKARALTMKENLAHGTVTKCGGNVAEAARQMEKSRQTVAALYANACKKIAQIEQCGRSVSARQQLPEHRPRTTS